MIKKYLTQVTLNAFGLVAFILMLWYVIVSSKVDFSTIEEFHEKSVISEQRDNIHCK